MNKIVIVIANCILPLYFELTKKNNELLKEYAKLDHETEEILQKAVNTYSLSMRGYNKILKVARTIADLSGKENILKQHVLEALKYRKAESMSQ